MDETNNEFIVGANIIIPEIEYGVATNSYGFYSITLEKKEYLILISSLGYQTENTEIVVNKNIPIYNITLDFDYQI